MNKLNIVILFGGCSSEYGVSLESAYSVISNMDSKKYNPIPVGITESGEWYLFSGDYNKIIENTWLNKTDCRPVILPPNRNEHRLLVFGKAKIEIVEIDAVFPVLHGKNGEDGTVQGLVTLAGLPLIGCGVLSSALCMDKDKAHRLASLSGVAVPRALSISQQTSLNVISSFADLIGYPLFVKPVKSGSSYGVTKVQNNSELADAVSNAFRYDDQVIVEENIAGFEVGCAIMGSDTLTIGELDEIELSSGFFDFVEKYTLKTSAIHVPARINQKKSDEIKETARKIYKALGCSGFARVDLFLTPDGTIVFNEVNTIPGFTEHSRFPGMMKAAGISFSEVLSFVIDGAVSK
ncbi:MAG: D-alanine--D-serine ligase VanG [Oscillospiraceae bacterium]|nr:D-alanine--D-serine ligase VanG [Oscillospiraceae bacterium]